MRWPRDGAIWLAAFAGFLFGAAAGRFGAETAAALGPPPNPGRKRRRPAWGLAVLGCVLIGAGGAVWAVSDRSE